MRSATLDKIKQDFHSARIARTTIKTNLLSTVIGEIESKAVMVDSEKTVSEETVVSVLKSFVKKADEFLAVKQDMKIKEEKEILESYLPKQLADHEIHMILLRSGVEKNMGALMKYLKDNYAGQYDGKVASQEVKRILS